MPNINRKKPVRIVILGGGFGGVYVFKRLHEVFHGEPGVALSLISRNNYFLFTPLLHEVATGGVAPENVSEPLRKVLRCCLKHLYVADVVKVETQAHYVETTAGLVPYDYLVVALGGRTDFFDVPGAEQHSFTLKSLGDAVRLKNHFIETFENASKMGDKTELDRLLHFAVVGGGATGVELAAEMSEFFHHTFGALYGASEFLSRVRITLFQRPAELLPRFPPRLRQKSLAQLESKGIEVRLGVSVVEVTRDYVELGTGERVPTATTIWVAGTKPEPIAFDCETARDRRGRLIVENTLQLQGHSDVFALGDVTACSSGKGNAPLPASAQVATRQADAVARNVRSLIYKRQLKPFTYKHAGDLVSLGHWFAVGEFRRLRFCGRLGWWLWRTVYLSKLISWRKRVEVALDWTVSLCSLRDVAKISDDGPAANPRSASAGSPDTGRAARCSRYIAKLSYAIGGGQPMKLADTCVSCALSFNCPRSS